MVDENGMDGPTTIEPEQYHPIAGLCYTWVSGQGEMNTRERHQVRLELFQINVQRTIETKRSRVY